MNEQDLKSRLLKLKESRNHLNRDKLHLLTKAMLTHLGSTDSELRDGLIYTQFVQLVLDDLFSDDELIQILETCMGEDFLYDRIGIGESDAVFKRSFSSLLIAVILHKNAENQFLDLKKLIKVADRLLEYLQLEKDIRGYVEGKGWAHSIAHVADTLAELAKQPNLPEVYLEKIFIAINWKMSFDKRLFSADEDERMTITVMNLLSSGLNTQTMIRSIKHVAGELVNDFLTGQQSYFHSRMNYKAFLRSLYFNVMEIETYSNLVNALHQSNKDLMKPYLE
ncbi:DUF2785 domain-containing protein [Tenuibacillus multivorans]|uniref:DUF2785 domain-containing protein n=1 Tax=Tenuibacillus multivorans TaxID=237069 RepID=A0A1H0AP07_9BACI|nr:DUF2785 domain-containing protein [Tenuibacillus multivorans]GEL78223.1 membrane protein [Tenuibacillus multivorans]SDN35217.1 Protein of unknown function [Tenuibacillus multivorans]